jgi:hypothetical protein
MVKISKKVRRAGLLAGFYGVLVLLLLTVVSSSVELENVKQLSAYDDGWDDLSAFRNELNGMGLDTGSVVSSPLLLSEIQDPSHTVFIIAGMERDTFSFPHFDDDGFISFSDEDGYSSAEVEAIIDFVKANGTVIVMDDFGFSSSLGESLGVSFSGNALFDTVYEHSLDYNYVWTCIQDNPCGMDNDTIDKASLGVHPTWAVENTRSAHPCLSWDQPVATKEAAGLCAQHWNPSTGRIEYNGTYQLLLNGPSSLEIEIGKKSPLATPRVQANSSREAALDVNGDGEIWAGDEQNAETPDIANQNFPLYAEVCETTKCKAGSEGRIIFVADGSLLSNALYDYSGFNRGDYGETTKLIPINDNRKWAIDLIAMALIDSEGEDVTLEAQGQVLFDESRHPQNALIGDGYNMVYFLLVYFTSEAMAMLLLFLALFVTFEAVLIKKVDPEPWRHVFSIIYYGFGDAHRYGFYAEPKKIKQVFLSKIRNINGLTREEFDSMPARELQSLIKDPVLEKFVFEKRQYSLEQMVTIVKRVKAWGAGSKKVVV